MFGKLEEIEVKYIELEQELAEPEIFNDQERYKKVSKAHSDLGGIVEVFREYKQISQDLSDNREMLSHFLNIRI